MGLPCKFPACRAGPPLKGLHIWGNRADQNFGPFLPPGPRWVNLIKIIILFNTQTNIPWACPASFQPVGLALYSRGFKFGEIGQIKILVHFWPRPQWVNLIKILSLFNTQTNRPWACPASFQTVGQALYSRGFKFGNWPDQNFCPFLPPGPRRVNLIKIFSLFNTQTNRPWAFAASFQPVDQALYSNGFKFGEIGQIGQNGQKFFIGLFSPYLVPLE